MFLYLLVYDIVILARGYQQDKTRESGRKFRTFFP